MAYGDVKVLVVAPHPDDEALGAGIWLHRHRKEDLHILHVTDGSPRDLGEAHARGLTSRRAYAALRRKEFLCSLPLLAVPPSHCFQMSIVDKETYLHLPSVVGKISALIAKLQPDRVFAPTYEGGHPDHDSAALAVSVARRRGASFEHIEFPLYRAGKGGAMVTQTFLPNARKRGNANDEEILTLSAGERKRKKRILDCHVSQSEMLLHFELDGEPLRHAPEYDFTKPPHPGRLLYEIWNWGISGEQWRERAAAVL